MSLMQHPGAYLQRWGSPVYPRRLPEIARILYLPGNEPRPDMVLAAQATRGYLRVFRNKTDDGYNWFRMFQFRVTNGSVVIALPWAQDFDARDGVVCDRSPAVYTAGPKIQQRDISSVVARYIDTLMSSPRTVRR